MLSPGGAQGYPLALWVPQGSWEYPLASGVGCAPGGNPSGVPTRVAYAEGATTGYHRGYPALPTRELVLSRVGDRPTATILHAQYHLFDFCLGF